MVLADPARLRIARQGQPLGRLFQFVDAGEEGLPILEAIATRARPRFMGQWRNTGVLNAQIEETFTGHAIVKAFGRQHDVEERFPDKTCRGKEELSAHFKGLFAALYT